MPNILIADDHDLVRDTIAAYLSRVEEFKILTASNLSDALKVLEGEWSIDLAVLDYNMPGMDGLAGLEKAVARFPTTRFALMSGVATPEVAKQAMDVGAIGFFPKSLAADTMVNAVRFVLSGERYFPFGFESDTPPSGKKGGYCGLSGREIETLRGLCQGKSNKEIARELDLQEVTIKLHVKNIFAKLGVKNRTQAALRARDDGFV